MRDLSTVVGSVVHLDDGDYKYGIGRMRIRVGQVTPMRSEPGWAMVTGVQLDFRGAEIARREILVRAEALTALADAECDDCA
jgi:hypothetical protein